MLFRAQGRMQDRPVFRFINGLPFEITLHGLVQAAFPGQGFQEVQGFFINAVLGIIHQEAIPANTETGSPVGVRGKKVFKVFGF